MSPNDPTHDQTLREQLSAWMDGELPADEARFLERRLAHDPVLAAQWERWQRTSACLRGLPPAPAMDVSAGVAAALARPAPAAHGWRWAAGLAAVLALGVLLPGLGGGDTSPGLPDAPALALPGGPTPSPSARRPAELVAGERRAPASPAPAAAAVPVLAEALEAKPWPRSPLAPDAGAMAPYVARHSAAAGQAGLGGFMPYVDVVAQAPDEVPAPVDDEPRQ